MDEVNPRFALRQWVLEGAKVEKDVTGGRRILAKVLRGVFTVAPSLPGPVT